MKRKRIVTIGGGTGSFTLLSGLKRYPVDLSAVVSMADDGGSTGVLRDELGVLPPGDVRQCLIALSESSEKMRALMSYRFEEGSLKGHSFGNIFVSALEKTCGGMSSGLVEASGILKVRGRVLPVTEDDMRLVVELENGTMLYGEGQLDGNRELRLDGVLLKSIALQKKVRANKRVLEAVAQADAIVLGPGDQFGSLVPNLLVDEVAQAVGASRAQVVYVCNLTNKRGLTTGWSVRDYVDSLEAYIGRGRIDTVVWNSRRMPRPLLEKYEEQEGPDTLVRFTDYDGRTYRLCKADVLGTRGVHGRGGEATSAARTLIRHDPHKLARAVMFLLDLKENDRVIRDIV